MIRRFVPRLGVFGRDSIDFVRDLAQELVPELRDFGQGPVSGVVGRGRPHPVGESEKIPDMPHGQHAHFLAT